MAEQEEFNSDNEEKEKPARKRPGKANGRIEILGHKSFSMLDSCNIVFYTLYLSCVELP